MSGRGLRGGIITVSSIEGNGTTFQVNLPLN
jgi:signal transduction histidine kinase